MADLSNILIREASDDDAEGLICMIGEIFKEYDCVLELDDLDSELLAIDTYIKALNGKFWVAEYKGKIVGSIGYSLEDNKVVGLKRLYVANNCRRKGLANKLTDLVYQAAEKFNGASIACWSDTRFLEAHAFYLKHGFEQQLEIRDLHDTCNSTEYQFIKTL